MKERTIREFNHEQLILAETASQGISLFFDNYQSDLTFLAQIDDIVDFSDDGKRLLANFHQNHKNLIEAITRVDSGGTILNTYPENEAVIGKDISYQQHVSQVLTTHKPVISDVFMAVQGYMAIAMHVPVFKDGKFVGSLGILIQIDKLGKRYLGNMKLRGSGNVWIMSKSGIEIYCPVAGHTGKSYLDITHHHSLALGLIEKINTESCGTLKSIHVQKENEKNDRFIEKYITFYRTPLGNTYWTILISYLEEEVYITLTQLRNRLILIFSLLLIIMLYYFYSFTKVRNLLKTEEIRKQAEKTLRESEEKFRTIFDESPIGIELYKADGMQIDANKASLIMFGISDLSEIKDFNLFDGTSLDDDKLAKLRNGQPIAYQALFDFERVKKLGQYKTNRTGKTYFDYIIKPLFDDGRQTIIGYLLQVQDISERKHNEEEIIMLAHALESVSECVSITDLSDKIIFVNDSFANTYGYTHKELTGRKMDWVRTANNPPELLNQILPATLKGGWKGELLNKRKDGSEFPIYLSTNIIYDKAGKPIGLIGVALDITERKRNEKELVMAKEKAEESDRLKTTFLANLSHEICTPMNGVLGFANLLKEPNLTGEQQLEYAEIIENSGRRMLNIINNIIDISIIESGQLKVSISKVDINQQLKTLFNLFMPEAQQKGIRLILKNLLPEKEAVIKTDELKFFGIMNNLLKNAIKFTNRGSVEFGLSDMQNSKSLLQFYVKDTGPGIAKNRQQAIFERFVQADPENKNALQGAGLGLAICKAYNEILGGSISLESDEDTGSTFSFSIPVVKDND